MTVTEFRKRFWAQVDRKGRDECWPWMASCNTGGYGVHYVPRELRGKFLSKFGTIVASRIAFALSNGPLEKGMQIDHICFNPSCVNPRHLQQVSVSENCRRQWQSERLFPPVVKERCPVLAAILQEELDGSNFYDRINQRPIRRSEDAAA